MIGFDIAFGFEIVVGVIACGLLVAIIAWLLLGDHLNG
jgi:hypothetical protein